MNKTPLPSILQHLMENDKLTSMDATDISELMRKEVQLRTVVDLSRIKYREDDNRPYIYIKRKQYIAANYIELLDLLYDLFFGEDVTSIDDLYPDWLIWRRDYSNVSLKTIKENMYLYETYFEDTELVKIPLTQLKPVHFLNQFRKMTKGATMTVKRFNDAKSVLNGIMYYAIENEIIQHNIIKDINYRQFSFKPENTKKEIFTLEERTLILNYLSNNNDMYPLAIQFDFYVIMRIGELKALRWSDIEGDYIKIHSQELEVQTMNDDLTFNARTHENVDYVKGHTSEGIRYIPLTDGAKKILERAKMVNPTGEFIFMQDNRQLTTSTFNKHLKKICKELDIAPRSSHKIRFTVASALYHEGVKPTQLQQLLGHTTLAMTLHYLRDITPDNETMNQMCNILG